ncbi:MAG: tRNA (adenosine(37)-N6)-threonylcarbamoyltransferase complex ATPase subunit type 1 TsaE [Calditerrivibrio sp.]|nr:tRNA (adenosine(37)-N6)-threonylcarbamoyltransferase complex ATPase subunit type 1 TsaE [Calditerrivibrio sp.]MCA1932826.1 tRNA (adenosine(37)-N6)-threonylcarbamoyltransferase complex ATPase subunit type 1 TsaE [Calditerrivibrio sp.]
MRLEISSLDELKEFISKNLDLFKNKIILLDGELGAGKTAFVKILGSIIGFEDVNSPTFTVMNIYRVKDEIMYHYDLYRLNSLIELENIGFFDYIDSGNTICIEWASKFNITDYLDEYILVFFNKVDEQRRILDLKQIRR